MKLITLSEFVLQESEQICDRSDFERLFCNLVSYNEFLSIKLTNDMFKGENPLFAGFVRSHDMTTVSDLIGHYLDEYDENHPKYGWNDKILYFNMD